MTNWVRQQQLHDTFDTTLKHKQLWDGGMGFSVGSASIAKVLCSTYIDGHIVGL